MRTLTAMDAIAFKREPLEESYEIGDDIGSGHFAVVRRALHKKSGEAFAAKFIRKRRGGGRKGAKAEDIQREVSILRLLDHENVIRLYDVYETGIEVILILELVTGGELFDYISEKDHLGEEEASAFIAQILRGVKHLHDHNIAHLDLKPENIMLRNRSTQSIKLIDFGLAQRIQGKEDIRALMGTAEFVAPEVVSYETLSLATDMWSVGVITYILLSGASPFLGDNQQETYHNITAINFQFDEEYFSNTSELAKDFIEKLFVKMPKKRATVDDCLNHPWIRPKEPLELIKRQSAVINIDNFKAFMARKRWKQSMRVVSLCNRLSKSILLRKSTDTMGSRNTLDEDKPKLLPSVRDQSHESLETAEEAANSDTKPVTSKLVAPDERCADVALVRDHDQKKSDGECLNGLAKSSTPQVTVVKHKEVAGDANCKLVDSASHDMATGKNSSIGSPLSDDLKSQNGLVNLPIKHAVFGDLKPHPDEHPKLTESEGDAQIAVSVPSISPRTNLCPSRHQINLATSATADQGLLTTVKDIANGPPSNKPVIHKTGVTHSSPKTIVSNFSLSPACNQRVLRVSSDVSSGLDDLIIESDDVFYDPQDTKSKRSSVRLTLKPRPAGTPRTAENSRQQSSSDSKMCNGSVSNQQTPTEVKPISLSPSVNS